MGAVSLFLPTQTLNSFVCSANGIWINGKKMINQIQKIKTNDQIFFLDPTIYKSKGCSKLKKDYEA